MVSSKHVMPSQVEGESKSMGKHFNNDEEKRKMHHNLWRLMDKVEEMTQKIGASLSIN